MFEATCGNGQIEPGEQCDDGNTTANDGCSATCQIEPGGVCGGAIDLNDPTKVTVKDGVTTYQGTTAGSANTMYGTPSCSAGTTDVPRVVHRYRVGGHPAVLRIDTADIGGSLVDTVVWAYRDCFDTSKELACGEDPGALYGALDTGWLPAGTTVFIVVSGYGAADVGAYELRVTETPATLEPASGTCASPVNAAVGTYAGATLATDVHNGSATSACGGSAPDAVYAITLASTSDVKASVTTTSASYDMTLSLLTAPCGTGMELACADAAGSGSGESLAVKGAAAGTYYLVVGGFGASDVGPYTLSLSLVDVLPEGAACDPASTTSRCDDGRTCEALTCQKPKAELLFADFSADLAPFSVSDAGSDGQSWIRCDPANGCFFDNTTGGNATDPYALVHDAPGVSLDGEALVSPALDASMLSKVVVELDHAFDHVAGAADLGAVEVSLDGAAWTTVASFTADAGGHAAIDLSAKVAGKPKFYLRFRYDDQTSTTADPFAGGWSLDNVHVYGF
jgi:cysteine-rich repeat protein